MPQKKPIILDSDGRLKELGVGDTISGAVASASVTATNDNAGSITLGQPVYVSGSDSVDLARANSDSTSKFLGLVASSSVSSGSPAVIQIDGILVGTVDQWDVVLGQTGSIGLTPGEEYILDPDNPGQLVSRNFVIDAGEWVKPVGVAVSSTDFKIQSEIGVKRQ